MASKISKRVVSRIRGAASRASRFARTRVLTLRRQYRRRDIARMLERCKFPVAPGKLSKILPGVNAEPTMLEHFGFEPVRHSSRRVRKIITEYYRQVARKEKTPIPGRKEIRRMLAGIFRGWEFHVMPVAALRGGKASEMDFVLYRPRGEEAFRIMLGGYKRPPFLSRRIEKETVLNILRLQIPAIEDPKVLQIPVIENPETLESCLNRGVLFGIYPHTTRVWRDRERLEDLKTISACRIVPLPELERQAAIRGKE